MTPGAFARAAADHVRYRAMRRAGVPAAERRWVPARTWALLAVGIAAGPWLEGTAQVAVPLALVVFGLTRPGRGALLCVALAVAVIGGGLRANAIDRVADAPERSADGWRPVTLREPLPAGARDRSASALGTLAGRPVIVMATKFGVPSPAFARGTVVAFRGRVVPLGRQGNDARLRRLGVGLRLQPTELRATGRRRGGPLGAIDRFADGAQATLHEAVGARRGALLAGMALGTDDGIGEADREALRTSGLWHLVAASGGNIALVVALVMTLGWLVGMPDRWRLLACAAAICAYVPLAGAGPSIQRAGVMGLAGVLALALGRERRGADALAFAAVATLALDPRATLDVGWQLSFAAAGGLIAGAGPAARGIAGIGAPRWLAVGLACTVVATVVTAPITLLAFGQVSLIGLVANALALPLVGIAVWSGTLAAAFTPVVPGLAWVCAQPGGVAAGLVLEIATWSERRAYAVVGWEGALVVVVAVALVTVVRPPRLVVGLGSVLAFLGLAFAVPRPPSEPRMVVFDIGQGNATLVQDGDEGVLIDAGPVDGGVVGALRRSGVRRLRAVVLSHPAADHDGGAAAAIDAFPTDLLLDGGDPGGGPTHAAAVRAARRRGAQIVPVRAGQRLGFRRIALRVRWPTPRAAGASGDPNDRAAIIEAQVGTLRALLPADAEGNVLTTLPRLQGEVLVVSHHGSNDDALPSVLRRLRPQLAVISLGTPNTYGHPTPATLAALRTAAVPTMRTDRDGSLDIRADAAGRVTVGRIATPGR